MYITKKDVETQLIIMIGQRPTNDCMDVGYAMSSAAGRRPDQQKYVGRSMAESNL